jgi:hypothetical protein
MGNALSGTAGSVVYMTGGTTVAGSIKEWKFNISHSPVQTTTFGDVWESFIPSLRNATGSFAGNFDNTDSVQTSLESAMLGGSACAFRLYISPTKYYNVGTAYLTGHGPSISNEGKAETSFDFQVSGPVTFV